MDLKVLEAYAESDPEGHWLEVEVPPYCPMNDADKEKLSKFEGRRHRPALRAQRQARLGGGDQGCSGE